MHLRKFWCFLFSEIRKILKWKVQTVILYLYYPVEIIRVAKYWPIQTEGRRPEVCIGQYLPEGNPEEQLCGTSEDQQANIDLWPSFSKCCVFTRLCRVKTQETSVKPERRDWCVSDFGLDLGMPVYMDCMYRLEAVWSEQEQQQGQQQEEQQ